MRWLLITGAGASRDLGADRPMPLMGDWAGTLRNALDRAEHGLSGAVGLDRSVSGPEFEETIGAFLQWRDSQPLRQRFLRLASQSAANVDSFLSDSLKREKPRANTVVRCLNETLYAEFGTDRVDEAAALDAYRRLLDVMGTKSQLVVVTTNYDPVAELALSALELRPDTGFHRPPVKRPVLRPRGLIDRSRDDASIVPVLHLHGAVGWYEVQGVIYEQHQDLEFNPTLGRPVVLYPDPEKDPTGDPAVRALWGEFDLAIADADALLVVGHSLHDDPLVERLREVAVTKPVGIGVYAPEERSPDVEAAVDREMQRVVELIGGQSNAVPLRFAPGDVSGLHDLTNWGRTIEEQASGDPT